jgi:cytochrome c oxidase assembly factor CtaG
VPSLVLAHSGEGPVPPLTAGSVWSSWVFDPWLLAPLLLLAALYLLGVQRLRVRGDAWSGWRTASWLLGLLLMFVATSSVVAVYDTTLFSMHALQHMILQMFAPVPLAMAAPVTLLLRTGGVRVRNVVLWVMHSRVVRLVTRPPVAFAIFVVTPFVLYYSPLYEATLRHDWLHNLSHVHFVAVGLLLYVPLLGLDPIPNPMPFLYRFLMIVGVGPSHILLGLPIMLGGSGNIIAEDFYRQLDRDWGPSLLADQHVGGALLWILGDIVVLAFLAGMMKQWNKAERREQRRVDRQLDREFGDAATIRPWWLPEPSEGAERPSSGR